MSLDRYRRPRLVVLPPKSSAYEAARAMAEHHVGSVLVGDGRDIVGIVTDRDLALAVIAGDLPPRATALATLMATPVVSIDVGASPAEAAQLMRRHACRRLPVTEDGLPVGIVTLDDLLHDAEVLPTEARGVLAAQFDSTLPPESAAHPESSEVRARARMRRRARAEATMTRLLRTVERNSGIQDRAQAERAIGIVLGAVCRRLTPEQARSLVAQLPSKLHPELLECLDGPDKRITTPRIEHELQIDLDLPEQRVTEILYAVCDAVADTISEGEVDAVRAQLPAEMKQLFPEVPYRRVG